MIERPPRTTLGRPSAGPRAEFFAVHALCTRGPRPSTNSPNTYGCDVKSILMGIRRVVIPHCGGEISLLHRRLVGACRAPCSKRGESAGARPSGFVSRALDTPTGANVGEGRLGDMSAAERAGSAHGATTAPKRAIFLVDGGDPSRLRAVHTPLATGHHPKIVHHAAAQLCRAYFGSPRHDRRSSLGH